jgi:ubiquinone/menaquinone biosynthesis C-methylase UbiE
MTLVSVDRSRRMIRQAQRQPHTSPRRVEWIQADIRQLPIASDGFDLIVTHFALDCLTDPEIKSLAVQVQALCAPGAIWLISEFQEAGSFVRTALIKGMYLFFRVAAGLSVLSLPDYAGKLRQAGWRRALQKTSLRGFLTSEIWDQEGGEAGQPLPRRSIDERVLPDELSPTH